MLPDPVMMSGKTFQRSLLAPSGDLDFTRLARRIGVKLRDLYRNPEAEQLPADHVQLLLTLRQKERDARRH